MSTRKSTPRVPRRVAKPPVVSAKPPAVSAKPLPDPSQLPNLSEEAAIKIVCDKYKADKWQCFRHKTPIVDLFMVKSVRSSRLHMIKMVPKSEHSGSAYNGINRSNFVQNAFSNCATGVYAVYSNVVELFDANTGDIM